MTKTNLLFLLIILGGALHNPYAASVFLGADEEWLSFLEWQAATGQDAHSVFADPRFVDPDNGNFTLCPDSPWQQRKTPIPR